MVGIFFCFVNKVYNGLGMLFYGVNRCISLLFVSFCL